MAIFATKGGKEIRAVASVPGLKAGPSRCIRKNIKGLETGITLPKVGFIEWRFRLKEAAVEAKAMRPKCLRGNERPRGSESLQQVGRKML